MHDDLRDFLDRDEHKELQKSKEAVQVENDGGFHRGVSDVGEASREGEGEGQEAIGGSSP